MVLYCSKIKVTERLVTEVEHCCEELNHGFLGFFFFKNLEGWNLGLNCDKEL